MSVCSSTSLWGLRRAQFVPQMVGALMKLGLPSGASLENRRLSLDIVALVLSWERQRRAPLPPAQARLPFGGSSCFPTLPHCAGCIYTLRPCSMR